MGRGILQVKSRKPYRSENPQKGRGEKNRSPRAWEKSEQKRKCGLRWDAEKQPCRGKAGPLVAAKVPLRPTPRRSPRWAEEEGADRGCSIRAETPERSWTQHFHPCDVGWLSFLPSKASVRRD